MVTFESFNEHSPPLVARHEALEQASVLHLVVAGGDDEMPGLVVETGGRPSRRLQERIDRLGGDGLLGESAGAPAFANELVER